MPLREQRFPHPYERKIKQMGKQLGKIVISWVNVCPRAEFMFCCGLMVIGRRNDAYSYGCIPKYVSVIKTSWLVFINSELEQSNNEMWRMLLFLQCWHWDVVMDTFPQMVWLCGVGMASGIWSWLWTEKGFRVNQIQSQTKTLVTQALKS